MLFSPHTSSRIPHCRLEQTSPSEIYEALLARFARDHGDERSDAGGLVLHSRP